MKAEHSSQQSVILVVDDNPRNLQVISTMLTANGFKVVVASSGQSALKSLEIREPDLVLLDIMMPDMNGYEVCGLIKANQQWRDIPVVFLTAKAELSDIIQGFRLGAVDYITKPFRIEEVLARIKNHLDLRHAKIQLEQQNSLLQSLNQELESSRKTIQQDARKLKRMNEEKDRLFSIIAHDLRGPIRSFVSLAELFLDDETTMEPLIIRELATGMHQSALSLHELLENLLNWSLMQQEKAIVREEELDMKLLFQRAVNLNQERIAAKEIQVFNQLEPQCRTKADENMVSTIIRNLISNAVKFTPRGGKVFITSRQADNNMMQFVVQDSGIGMSPELMGKLFDYDKKVCRPGTEGEPSSGLGLMIIREFVHRNGGELGVESVVQEGSKFSFTLKRA
jgi:two-component system, sensor histidine kinase and response regulator